MANGLVLMSPTEPDRKVRSDDLRGERLRGGTIDIHDRTFVFAARILQLVRSLPNDLAGRTIARQLARSGTSIGANVEEAQGGHSKAEFARRMGIARPEAREALYWLRLIIATKMIAPDRLVGIRREGEEIAKILTAIVKKARRPQKSANLRNQPLAISYWPFGSAAWRKTATTTAK